MRVKRATPAVEPESAPEPKKRPANSTAWKKGQSGNPDGRFHAKGITEAPDRVPKTVAKGTLEALRVEINKFDPVIMRRLKKIVQSPYFNKVRPEVVIRACELLLAYEYGRPKAREESKGGTVQDFLAFLTAAQSQARLLVAAGGHALPPRESWTPRPLLPPGVVAVEHDKGNGRIIDADENSHADE